MFAFLLSPLAVLELAPHALAPLAHDLTPKKDRCK